MDRKSVGANQRVLIQLRKHSKHLSLLTTKSTIISSGCTIAVASVLRRGEGDGEGTGDGVGDGEGDGEGEDEAELDEYLISSKSMSNSKTHQRKW